MHFYVNCGEIFLTASKIAGNVWLRTAVNFAVVTINVQVDSCWRLP